VATADQRCRQPIQIGHRPYPTGGGGELAGGDRVLADHREPGIACLPGGHGALGPAAKKPRPTRRMADLPRCLGAQHGPDRARRGAVLQHREPGRHRTEVHEEPHRRKAMVRPSDDVAVTGRLAMTVLLGFTSIQDHLWSTDRLGARRPLAVRRCSQGASEWRRCRFTRHPDAPDRTRRTGGRTTPVEPRMQHLRAVLRGTASW
jgi:hypothetical protein